MLLQPWQVVWLAEQTLRPHCWYPPSANHECLQEVAETSVATVSAAAPSEESPQFRTSSRYTTVQSDVPQTYVVGFTSLNTDDNLRSRLADRD